MSLQIQRGLFILDFTDHYAILGVSVDADAKDIRKRYLKIARTLHPDSFVASSEVEKQKATEILSKLVIPANEKLSQERERAEYAVLLRLKGQQALRQQDSLQMSDAAKQLSKASDIEVAYKRAVQQLAEKQYDSLEQVLEVTAQISELNLAYILHKTAKEEGVGNAPRAAKTSFSAAPAPTASGATPTPVTSSPKTSIIDPYCRRAEDYIKTKNLAKAVLELRDALQLEPNNARCHGLLGSVYLLQNQVTMAKIHLNKALQLNPNDLTALEAKKKLEGGNKQASKPAAKPDKPGGGFFGLFGGKKK